MMKDNSTQSSKVKSLINGLQSINDLRELEYQGIEISTQQRLAIKNFDRYRISQLNSQTTEEKFHQKYMQLQVMANLTPFEEFLKEEYFL